MDNQKELLISVLISAFFGGLTASLAAIRKSISVSQALVAVSIAVVFSSAAPFALMAWGMHWGFSVPISAFLGLLIFGFLALVDKTEKQIPSIDPTGLLPAWVRDKLKTKPQDGDKQ
jgi:ABC-type amino acid transport substrate-binding protein